MGARIPITGSLSLQVRDALVTVLGTSAQFSERLLEVDQFYDRLKSAELSYETNVLKIVKLAAEQGWILDFIFIVLTKVHDPELQRLSDLLVPLVPPAVDPFEVCQLTGGYVMVDRANLRESLRNMTSATGKRILIVKGDPKSGKTHTVQLIFYVELARGSFSTVHINLETFTPRNTFDIVYASSTTPIQIFTSAEHEFASGVKVQIDGVQGSTAANGYWTIGAPGPKTFTLMGSIGNGTYTSGGTVRQVDTPVDAYDLAERLVNLMEYDIRLRERPSEGQWSRWIVFFCDSFRARAKKEREQRWIIVDAFGSVLLAPSAMDLVKALSHSINENLPLLRLVLLGFEDSLPANVLGHVEEEGILPIKENHIIAFFASAFKQLQIPFDEDKVLEAVERVLEKAHPDEPDFLVKLGPLASEELVRAAKERV